MKIGTSADISDKCFDSGFSVAYLATQARSWHTWFVIPSLLAVAVLQVKQEG